jgi:hypothetical protein
MGWHRNSSYREIIPDHRGWLWCATLGLWLGPWAGTIDRETLVWLRFYDADGQLVLLPEEAVQQRAERLAARLRELGEDPDSL